MEDFGTERKLHSPERRFHKRNSTPKSPSTNKYGEHRCNGVVQKHRDSHRSTAPLPARSPSSSLHHHHHHHQTKTHLKRVCGGKRRIQIAVAKSRRRCANGTAPLVIEERKEENAILLDVMRDQNIAVAIDLSISPI